jgi:hypothetical protein
MVKSFKDIVTIDLYHVVSEHIPLQENIRFPQSL